MTWRSLSGSERLLLSRGQLDTRLVIVTALMTRSSEPRHYLRLLAGKRAQNRRVEAGNAGWTFTETGVTIKEPVRSRLGRAAA